jgi:ferredoxin
MSESSSAVFFFSGTGNSFDAARQISARIGNTPLRSMAGSVPSAAVGGADSVVGFVFPSYYGMLPRAVKRFVESLEILPGTYCFAVVTMGGPFGKSSIVVLKELLADKNIPLQYGKGIVIAPNYIVKYNPPDGGKVKKIMGKVQRSLERAILDISARKYGRTNFIRLTANNLYEDIERLDEAFSVGDSCNRCGLCAKICPVYNIGLSDGSPRWQHHCEQCMACIHWCPKEAIQYGNQTQKRRRYHHPDVTALDLIHNSQAGADK